jgi:hypothetical protein
MSISPAVTLHAARGMLYSLLLSPVEKPINRKGIIRIKTLMKKALPGFIVFIFNIF